MKGVLILTEARSGSNWLGGLANATGRMGRSAEWLDPALLGPTPDTAGALLDRVAEKGATDNGRFAAKLFPRHLAWAEDRYSCDFIAECRKRHDTGFILLERRDRLRQAVSFARAKMTGKFKSFGQTGQPENYDAGLILQCYFVIERSYAFWRAYLHLADVPHAHLYYEDLQNDPAPYLEAAGRILDVDPAASFETPMEIQRDAVTEEWAGRFVKDVQEKGLMAGRHEKPASRNVDNLLRLLAGRPLRGPLSIY